MISEIEKKIGDIFEKLGYDSNQAILSVSKFPDKFDYQINSIFSIAKEIKDNPVSIGTKIVNEVRNMYNFSFYFELFEFCNPGFINIKLAYGIINKYIPLALDKSILEGSKYVLDYGGPNIAKPLHVGHLRPAIIGESIKRILKYTGNEVISDAHLGDFGLQIGEVIYGLKKENIDINSIDLKILERIYPSISSLCKTDEDVLNECHKITKELQEGNEEYIKYYKKIYEISLNDIKRLYNYLGVSFDLWNGESDSYKYIPSLVEYLEAKNLVVLDSGAKIIPVKEESDNKEMPPLILQKSDGAYLYATTDLATIYERMQKYSPDYILYVTDERQRMHFEQVFRVCKKSELTPNTKLEHNYFGTINGMDGKPFKTRSGDLLKLDELINDVRNIFISKKEENKLMSEEDINKVVNSIIKFADLQNNREANYIFDINKFSDTTGKTGPYVLYTAVRIRKIINDNKFTISDIYSEHRNTEERNLKLKIVGFYDAVLKSAKERMPHYICEYIYDLSVTINSFYQKNNISNEQNEKIKNEWLNLLNISYNILEKALNLLIIDIPSKM